MILWIGQAVSAGSAPKVLGSLLKLQSAGGSVGLASPRWPQTHLSAGAGCLVISLHSLPCGSNPGRAAFLHGGQYSKREGRWKLQSLLRLRIRNSCKVMHAVSQSKSYGQPKFKGVEK